MVSVDSQVWHIPLCSSLALDVVPELSDFEDVVDAFPYEFSGFSCEVSVSRGEPDPFGSGARSVVFAHACLDPANVYF